jgi:hypothetical protein
MGKITLPFIDSDLFYIEKAESWLASRRLLTIKAVLAVDDSHVAFCEYNGSVARIICVAVATLANEKLLERASMLDKT